MLVKCGMQKGSNGTILQITMAWCLGKGVEGGHIFLVLYIVLYYVKIWIQLSKYNIH